MRTLYRILLAALMADLVGTFIISILAASFAGRGGSENAVSEHATLVALIMAYGAMFALPAAALGVLLGDFLAPADGFSRGLIFVLLGAVVGSVLGTPFVGGLSGAVGGYIGSRGRRIPAGEMPLPRPAWLTLSVVTILTLLCLLFFLSLFGIFIPPIRALTLN